MTGLDLRGVEKSFGGTSVLAAIDLAVAPGEVVALLGPSGSGKTTLLRLVAGFERADRGRIAFAGRTLDDGAAMVPPERRGFGFVFQNFALWPHLDAGRNVRYPLDRAGVAHADARRRATAALDLVGLAGFSARDVASLSGGQRQRVGLARALVAAPPLVLLDEPLANLDPHLKDALLAEIAAIRRRMGTSMLYVTHDQAEAMTLADRIAVIADGRLRQVAPPWTLYREPADDFVARFVGRGALIPARVLGPDRAEIAGRVMPARTAPWVTPGPARALIRPEAVRPDASGLPARVTAARYRGGGWEATVALGDTLLTVDLPDGGAPEGMLSVSFDPPWILPV